MNYALRLATLAQVAQLAPRAEMAIICLTRAVSHVPLSVLYAIPALFANPAAVAM